MKWVLLVILYFLIIIPVDAEFITGGVEVSVDSARNEVFNEQTKFVNPIDLSVKNDADFYKNTSNLLKGITSLRDRKLGKFSDGTYAVMYYDNPQNTYYYSKTGELLYKEIKTGNAYPYKAFKYKSDGTLVNCSLKISPDEVFIFSVNGKLIAHWIGTNCFDEVGNVIMTRKIYQ